MQKEKPRIRRKNQQTERMTALSGESRAAIKLLSPRNGWSQLGKGSQCHYEIKAAGLNQKVFGAGDVSNHASYSDGQDGAFFLT